MGQLVVRSSPFIFTSFEKRMRIRPVAEDVFLAKTVKRDEYFVSPITIITIQTGLIEER